MVVMEEKYFPRGGKKTFEKNVKTWKGKRKLSTSEDPEPDQIEIPEIGSKKKKVIKSSKKEEEDTDSFYISPLSIDDISEGLLTLGKITAIKSYELVVSLPGQIVGKVQITQISSPYSEILDKIEKNEPFDGNVYPLEEMFHVGQTLSLKVISVQKEGKQTLIYLSTNPAQIYSNYLLGYIREGMVFLGAVKSIEDRGYIMDIGISGINSFLPLGSVDNKDNNKSFGIGELVLCKIVKMSVHRLSAKITLSAKARDVKNCATGDEFSLNYQLIIPGMLVDATIMQKFDSGLKVHFLDMIGTIQQEHLEVHWPKKDKKSREDDIIGSNVKARILSVYPSGTRASLSLRPGMIPLLKDKEVKSKAQVIKPGERHQVIVRGVEKRGLVVSFRSHPSEKGIVYLARLADDLSKLKSIADVKAGYPVTSVHTARVLKYSSMDDIYTLTFQESLLEENAIVSSDELKPGQIVQAVIKFWNAGGAMVSIGKINGFIPRTHFGEIILTNLQEKFPQGKKFKARVFQFKHGKNVLLTAKKSLIRFKGSILHDIQQVEIGEESAGVIFKVEKFGLLICAIGGLMGIMTKESIPDFESRVQSEFFVGQTIEFAVAKCNPEKNRMTFIPNIGAKPEGDQGEENEKPKNRKRKKESIKEIEIEEGLKKKKRKKSSEAQLEKDENSKKDSKSIANLRDLEEIVAPKNKKKGEKVEENSKKKSKKNKDPSNEEIDEDKQESQCNITALEREKLKDFQIRYLETKLTDSEIEIPTTSDEFEKATITSPNSSILWTHFMAFCIQNKDVDKARTVARKALQAIKYNEEKERMNVWIAWLQIELDFGSPESIKAVFDDAVRNADEFSIYKTMGELYGDAGKLQEAEEIYRKMIEKFRGNPQVWIFAIKFAYKVQKDPESGMKIYNRFLNLPNSKQTLLKVAKEFSYLELNYGDLEKGKSCYEALLTSNPNLTDQWLVYANLLIKKGLYEDARNLLKRAISEVKGPVRVKAIINRFLEFEKQHGTTETYNHVLDCAKNYLTNVLDAKSDG